MRMNQWLATVGAGAALCLGASELLAQDNNSDNKGGGRQGRGGRGGPPDQAQIQQWQQQRMERYKTELEITDDAEWKAIQPLIQKVTDARMAMAAYAGFGRGGMMFGRGRGGPDGGPSDRGGRGGFGGGTPNPDVEALNKAVEGKASNAEMKAAIAKFQEARKAKMAELEKAQADLRKVLSVRQEAVATLNGWL
jgi:hypothetical protein